MRGARLLSRYALAGVWNTAFGYGVFAALIAAFAGSVHYLLLAAVSNVLAISNAYIVHKVFVFRTRGGYLREYGRYWVIYGASALLGMGALAVLVSGLHLSAYLAQAAVMGLQILFSFAGHRRFSFRPAAAPPRG